MNYTDEQIEAAKKMASLLGWPGLMTEQAIAFADFCFQMQREYRTDHFCSMHDSMLHGLQNGKLIFQAYEDFLKSLSESTSQRSHCKDY
ncbi:MAG: hypothetical protein ACKPCP_00415 [Sphaerospermopsis kisseleviana]